MKHNFLEAISKSFHCSSIVLTPSFNSFFLDSKGKSPSAYYFQLLYHLFPFVQQRRPRFIVSTTCFLFRYIQFYVHTLVTTWRRSPRAGTSRQSGQNIWRSQNAVSPEKACWQGRETMLIDDIDKYDENTLSVGVSSPPARLKSVGKRRNFLTWAALLTTLQIGECCSHSH